MKSPTMYKREFRSKTTRKKRRLESYQFVDHNNKVFDLGGLIDHVETLTNAANLLVWWNLALTIALILGWIL